MRTLGHQGLSEAWGDQECSLEEVMGGLLETGCRGGVLHLVSLG